MQTPSISIIMPIYNCEAYVENAILSIIEQTFTSWELIAVDDGSTDNSSSILERLASSDARIKVHHQKNAGVSAARQSGLDKTKGKYIIHVDADDWVEPNYLQELYDTIETTRADMVWCDAYVNESGVWKQPCQPNVDILLHSLLQQKIWGTLWNRLWRAEICKRESFLINCSMWEDLSFVFKCLLHAKSIAYLPKPLYHYRMNENSLTHTQQQKEISVEHQKVIADIENALQKSGKLQEYNVDLTGLKLHAIRDYIDDVRFRSYDKFLNTYPEAIQNIWEYKNYPNRLKVTAWLLQRNLKCLVPLVLKFDGLLRKLGLSKQI